MAFSPGKSKADLRAMMKKQRQDKGSNVKKVESPLAKYNSLGQLTCIVCHIPIKSEIIWNAHIQGKKHRQNVEELQSGRSKVKPPSEPRVQEHKTSLPSPSKTKRKGSLPEEQPVSKKKSSTELAMSSAISVPKKTKKKRHTEDYKEHKKKQKTQESSTPSMKDKLPEGFFDDATVDAKVRQVEVKNTAAEEWAKFQKEMEQQQQASRIMVEADEEATQVSRNITEIDEQIQRFANVEKLRDKQDEWRSEKLGKRGVSNDESGTSDDEEEFAEFMDWRSKGAFK